MKFKKGIILLMLCALAGGAATRCDTYEEKVADAKAKGVESSMFPANRQVRIIDCNPFADPDYLCAETPGLVSIPYAQETEDGLCQFKQTTLMRSVAYTAQAYKLHFNGGTPKGTKPLIYCSVGRVSRCEILEIYNGFAALPQECQ